jgi:hypothetical protein
MIIQKTIKFKVNSKDIKYYNNLGYNINSCAEIEIPIIDLQKGSSRKIEAVCDICGNKKNISYKDYNINIKKTNIYCCCSRCANIKREKTNIEKYGKKYQVETNNFKIKSKQTKIKKYGDENYTNRIKYKKTCQKKYNCENVFEIEEVKIKLKKTKLERYNNENFTNREKAITTNLKKYGKKYYNNHEKAIKTNLEKYGVKSIFELLYHNKFHNYNNLYNFDIKNWFKNNPDEIKKRQIWMSSDEFKQKSKKTCNEKYGVSHPMHIDSVVLKNHISGYWLKKYKETELYYRGTYEYDFLDKYYNKIGIKNCDSLYYTFDNKKRKYYPDFFIERLNLIVEIKSTYTYNRCLELNLEKKSQCIKNGFNYIFIIDKNYTEFEKFLKY